jgi:dihydroflavonol-4-reductase
LLTVVTGASGFLGGALVRALLAEERQVRAVDLRRGPGLAGLDVEWMPADVLDISSLEASFQGAEIVFHLAAVISVTGDPTGQVWAVNVDGPRNVAEAALHAGVHRLVHCSSVHAYDLEAGEHRVTETSPRATAAGLPVYDRSKAAGEAALRQMIDQGLDAVIVNPTGVVGPYDFAPSRMGSVFLALFRRRLPALIDGGFDWVDVRDVASSMLAAETQGRRGENYLLPGHHLSLPELAAVAEQVSGVPKPTFSVPMRFARLWSPLADMVSRRSANPLWYTTESLHALRFDPAVSGAKAQAELGHRPRPFDDTARDIHHWFTDQGLLP